MENFTMIPMTAWQLDAAAVVRATSARQALTAAGIAVRPLAPTCAAPTGFAFGADAAAGAVAPTAVKRDRAIDAITGKGHRGNAARVPGIPTWSPPI